MFPAEQKLIDVETATISHRLPTCASGSDLARIVESKCDGRISRQGPRPLLPHGLAPRSSSLKLSRKSKTEGASSAIVQAKSVAVGEVRAPSHIALLLDLADNR